jgi:hypothetical protein
MIELPEAAQRLFLQGTTSDEDRANVFRQLCDKDLADTARFWMQHCTKSRKSGDQCHTYDETLFELLLPELLLRLSQDYTGMRAIPDETASFCYTLLGNPIKGVEQILEINREEAMRCHRDLYESGPFTESYEKMMRKAGREHEIVKARR